MATDDANPNLAGDMTIEAKPTWYGGTLFRSRLEADWAATLDGLRITWEYEPETLTLPSGTTYIPDFRLPDLGTWIEVKGPGVPRIEKTIELAKTLACRCPGECTCEWPRGELVLIGHVPERYDVTADPRFEDDWYFAVRRGRNHNGHPRWSPAGGGTAWLGWCKACGRYAWTPNRWCRACDRVLIGGHAYNSGSRDLLFASHERQGPPAVGHEL